MSLILSKTMFVFEVKLLHCEEVVSPQPQYSVGKCLMLYSGFDKISAGSSVYLSPLLALGLLYHLHAVRSFMVFKTNFGIVVNHQHQEWVSFDYVTDYLVKSCDKMD